MLSENEAQVHMTRALEQNSLQLAYQTCIRFTNGKSSPHRVGNFQALLDTVHSSFLSDKTTATLLRESDDVKHAIVSCGNVELAEILLNNDYPVNLHEPECGLTALDCAIIFGKIDNVKLLVKRGASVNTEARYVFSSLYYYTKNFQDKDNDAYVLKGLLERYINLQSMDIMDNRELRDLEWLFTSGNRKTVSTALKSGIDFNSMEFQGGKSYLHLLLDNEFEYIIYILDELNGKFDLNTRDVEGMTVLMEASGRARVTAVECLLKHGADANAMSLGGKTILFHVAAVLQVVLSSEASKADALKITELLLRHGANAQIVLERGSTLLSDLTNHKRLGFSSKSIQLFAETIVAHLALLDTLKKSLLTDRTRIDLESDSSFKSHFDLCTRQLKEIRKVGAFYGTVNLFDLLIESDEKIVALTRNQEFILAFSSCVTETLSHRDTYYLNILRKRIAKAVDKMEQERRVALIIESLTGLCSDVYHTIIYKIISYLSFLDLQDLCKLNSMFPLKK